MLGWPDGCVKERTFATGTRRNLRAKSARAFHIAHP